MSYKFLLIKSELRLIRLTKKIKTTKITKKTIIRILRITMKTTTKIKTTIIKSCQSRVF